MSDPPSSLAASLADRYHVERELGAGGMATVYLARDLRHARRVAIKVREAQGSAAWTMAEAYAMVDDREQALAWMKVAIERGFTNERVWAEWDPFMSRYRADPTFQAYLARARELRQAVVRATDRPLSENGRQ